MIIFEFNQLYLNRASSFGLARRIMLGSDWLVVLKAPDWSTTPLLLLVPLLVPLLAEGEPHPAL